MSLLQVIKMIAEGQVLVIHAGQAMRAFAKNVQDLDLDTANVAYLDCNDLPGLLDEGEWDYYLTQPDENSEILDENMRKILSVQTTIPNRQYYRNG